MNWLNFFRNCLTGLLLLYEIKGLDTYGLTGPLLRAHNSEAYVEMAHAIRYSSFNFQMFIMINGKQKMYKGGLKSDIEAARLYDKAAIQLKGRRVRKYLKIGSY